MKCSEVSLCCRVVGVSKATRCNSKSPQTSSYTHVIAKAEACNLSMNFPPDVQDRKSERKTKAMLRKNTACLSFQPVQHTGLYRSGIRVCKEGNLLV